MVQLVGGIRLITAEMTYPVRHPILRPGRPIETCAYPLDNDPHSFHLGYYIDDQLVGVCSVCREAMDGTTSDATTWRIRGMAVLEHLQGKGIGRHLLEAAMVYAVQRGGPGLIWCTARVTAQSFYLRSDFVQQGDVFELAGIGPHVYLIRALTLNDQVSTIAEK